MHDDSDRQQLDAIWRDVQRRLAASVPDSTFQLWLRPLSAEGVRGTTLHLLAPGRIRSWVERRYSGLIREALEAVGGTLSEVSFDPLGGGGVEKGDAALNPNYTFERFVIGEGNRFAHAAALAAAEAPSEAYNPLFLHGPPGLGKTHLLVAVASYLQANAEGLSIRYTTAESFTNEFVEALRASGTEGFKRRYRDLDVLLVDDIQFLEGKPSTEEEFFHTFNALYEGGSQIVLSADRNPSQLSTLADRLRDRFEWGLTVAVEPPNLATRLTVLRRLVREAGIPDGEGDALLELAERISANVRQLHGALTRVIAHASLDLAAARLEADRRARPPLGGAQGGASRGDPAARRRGLRDLAGGAGRVEPGRNAAPRPPGRDPPDQGADPALPPPDRPALRRPRSLDRAQRPAPHRGRDRRGPDPGRTCGEAARRDPQPRGQPGLTADDAVRINGPHSSIHNPPAAVRSAIRPRAPRFPQVLIQLKKAIA